MHVVRDWLASSVECVTLVVVDDEQRAIASRNRSQSGDRI